MDMDTSFADSACCAGNNFQGQAEALVFHGQVKILRGQRAFWKRPLNFRSKAARTFGFNTSFVEKASAAAASRSGKGKNAKVKISGRD